MVTGFVISSFGGGSFLFGYLSLAIANPENAAPLYDVDGGKIFAPDMPQSDRAPRMIRINAIIWIILTFISLLLIKKPSKNLESDEVPIFQRESESNTNQKIIKSDESLDRNIIKIEEKQYIGFKEAISKLATWHLIEMVAICS